MIITLLVGLVAGLLDGMTAILPTWSADTSVFSTAGGASFGQQAMRLDGYFPVLTLFACLVLRYGLWVVLSAWQMVRTVYELIPFKAT